MAAVNTGGTSFLHRLREETGASLEEIVRAQTAARAIFNSSAVWDAVEALDNVVAADVQTRIRLHSRRLVERGTRWLLNNRPQPLQITETIELFSSQCPNGTSFQASEKFSKCSDEGKPPFRGLVQIDYAHAPTYEGSQAEVAAFAEDLRRAGWSSDSGFASHATSLAKDNIVTVLRPYAPNGSGGIEVRGECRDVTDHREGRDIINAPLPPDALS